MEMLKSILNVKSSERKFGIYIQTFYVRKQIFAEKEHLLWHA
jgi:hypothetical protein